MGRQAAVVYILWSLILIFSGIFIYRKITNLSNPSSLSSSIKSMKEAMDEDSKVP